jgi:carboxyl-terminal processing protease
MSRSLLASFRLANLRFLCVPSVVAILTAALSAGRLQAEPTAPTTGDRQITLAVASLLSSEHLSKHPLDNEISERCLERFLKMLDPWKLYFTQADVDALQRDKDDLDDRVRQGKVDFAFAVFKTFLQRVDQRVKLVDELLAQDQDFTVDEDIIIDPDATKYAKSDAETRDLWRKRIKYELLSLKADAAGKKAADAGLDPNKPVEKKPDSDKPPVDPHEKLTKRYHSLAKRMHQIDNAELLEMFLTALTTAYDPHTSYMSPRTLENFEIDMKLELDGIGAALSSDDGYTVVSKIVPGGAADKDGRLKPEDKVTGVGQNADGEIVDVVDMKLSDVVQLIRGKRGTVVRLQVQPEGSTESKIYNITRAEIKLTDSEARGQIVEQEKNGQNYRVGVIDLPSFYMDMEGARLGVPDFKSTTRDVHKLLDDFKAKGVDAVILDLRKNGGGSLTEAISLTGLFVDEGPIVQVKDSDGRVQHYDDLEPGAAWEGPLVVLTSKFSASASEIFAGAIQDYGRGLIVGDTTTHGKGTVQSLLDLSRKLFRVIPNAPQLGALKITMQQFYRPNGDSTQNRGVLADVSLPSITSQLPVGEADMDYALKFDQVDPAPLHKLGMVNRQIVDQLNKNSVARRTGNPDFDKIKKRIDRYLEQKNRKTVTLNEKKFLAEREELNTEGEEERQIEELTDPKKPIFDVKNYYNREALAIALDYLQLTRVAKAN